VPEVDVLTTLLVDEDQLFTDHAAAIADITINDAPIPMASIRQQMILQVLLDPAGADPQD
jgi:hypothetical protein